MAKPVETEKSSCFIPIRDVDEDSKWVQTQEIPVICRRLSANGFIHLTFAAESLRILAGGENFEGAGMRIRIQIVSQLEHAIDASQNPNPYPRADSDREQLGKYFSPRV